MRHSNIYSKPFVLSPSRRSKAFILPTNRHLKPFMRHSNSYSKPFVLSPSRRSKAFILPTSRHLKPFIRHSNIYSKPFVLSPNRRSKAFILPTNRHLKPFIRHSNIYSKPFVLSPSRRSKAFILPTSRHLKPFIRHSNSYSKPFVLSPNRRSKAFILPTSRHLKQFIRPSYRRTKSFIYPSTPGSRYKTRKSFINSRDNRYIAKPNEFDANENEDIVEIEHPIESYSFRSPKATLMSTNKHYFPGKVMMMGDVNKHAVAKLQEVALGKSSDDKVVSYVINSPEKENSRKNELFSKSNVISMYQQPRNSKLENIKGVSNIAGKVERGNDYYFDIVTDNTPYRRVLQPNTLKKAAEVSDGSYVLEIDD